VPIDGCRLEDRDTNLIQIQNWSFVSPKPHRLRHLSFSRRGLSTNWSKVSPKLSRGSGSSPSQGHRVHISRIGEQNSAFAPLRPPILGGTHRQSPPESGDLGGHKVGNDITKDEWHWNNRESTFANRWKP